MTENSIPRVVNTDSSIRIGLDLTCVPDLFALYSNALQYSFSPLAVPLAHPRFERDVKAGRPEGSQFFARSDLNVAMNRLAVENGLMRSMATFKKPRA